MQKKCYALFFGLFLLFLPNHPVFAEEITGLKLTISDTYLNLFWNNLSATVTDKTEGYAVQFSQKLEDINVNKAANLYETKAAGKSLRLATFNNPANTYWYLRIYTYLTENKKKYLGNGSKILKFKIDTAGTITSEEIAATNDTVSSSSNNSESTVINYEFGRVRVVGYDTFADFSWSKPYKMTSNEYDGFIISVSEKSTGDSPIIEAPIDAKKYELRIKGLKPTTQYYARGYFYKEKGGEQKKFGTGPIQAFKTVNAINRSANDKSARNILKIEKKAITSVIISTTSTTNNTSTTTTNTASTAETTPSVSSENLTDTAKIKKRITELKKQIVALQAEILKLKKKLK